MPWWLALLVPSAAEAQTAPACTSANTDGSYRVPLNWALKPSGLAVNTNFRLLFITSTKRDATATAIATYNTFVQTQAKAGHSAISDSYGNLFKVLGSTSAVNTRDNTSTTGTGETIYWLNGAKVADNYADFYDGSWDSYAGKWETGYAATTGDSKFFIFTGTNNNGTTSRPLGGQSSPRASSVETLNGPIGKESFRHAVLPGHFYALSPIFKVKPPATVKLSSVTSSVLEGEALTFGVTLSETCSSATAIPIRRAPLTATGFDIDFDSTNLTITVPAVQTSATGTVQTKEDDRAEGNEQFQINIFSNGLPAEVAAVAPMSSYVTIVDDDAVNVSESDGTTSVTEATSASRTEYLYSGVGHSAHP